MESVIKKLREQYRYTQTKLAEILGISRPTLINYENMEQDIPIPIVKSLSKLFNVSYECIIDNKLPESISEIDIENLLSITKNNAYYECNNKRHEVTKVVFNHKDTTILEWKKEVHLYCKDNSKFTIVIDYNEFYFFMSYIQLSLLVNLHKYAGRNFISIINQEPIKCVNDAISMGLI